MVIHLLVAEKILVVGSHIKLQDANEDESRQLQLYRVIVNACRSRHMVYVYYDDMATLIGPFS